VLPTITGTDLLTSELDIQLLGASQTRPHTTPALVLPCAATPEGQDDPARATDAAQRCAACPIASACLLEGLRLDAAWRRGEDPWGAYGCWGGVWFSPGHTPTPLRAGSQVYDYPSLPQRPA
jgi:hypothetical protein